MWQDPRGQGHRQRGRHQLHLRQGPRAAQHVRRRERTGGARLLPARPQLRALCHLFRRAGLAVSASIFGRRSGWRLVEPGGEPAADGDGRGGGEGRRVPDGRHQPA